MLLDLTGNRVRTSIDRGKRRFYFVNSFDRENIWHVYNLVKVVGDSWKNFENLMQEFLMNIKNLCNGTVRIWKMSEES